MLPHKLSTVMYKRARRTKITTRKTRHVSAKKNTQMSFEQVVGLEKQSQHTRKLKAEQENIKETHTDWRTHTFKHRSEIRNT